MNWAEISAIAACIGVSAAIFFQIKNLKQTRLSNSAKMVLDCVAIFDSSEWLDHRSRFAKMLLDNRTGIDPRRDTPVLEFFEELAYMTRRGVLDTGMVWNSFFWVIEHYYPAVTAPPNLLEKARKESGSRTLYRELIWLHKELCIVCAREEGSAQYRPPTDDEIKQFLEDEVHLSTTSY